MSTTFERVAKILENETEPANWIEKAFASIGNDKAMKYNTVAELKADTNLEAGNVVITSGYTTENDNGGAVYVISGTNSRACSIQLNNGKYAVLVGDTFNTRQIGIKDGDKAQAIINSYIADTSFSKLIVVDDIHLKKPASGQSAENIDLVKINRDNFVLEFRGGKFTLETLGEDYYRMISVSGTNAAPVKNVVIIDPVLTGDADTIGIEVGEQGHGLFIYDASNITVYNGNISKCFGDAVVIAAGADDVTFIGTLYCSSCGRQGISVVDGKNIFFDNIVGSDIRRTSPSAVIDFEPNSADHEIIARVNTVRAINCKKAVLVAGPADKAITIGTVISEHDSNAYDNDVEIYGTANSNTDFDVSVEIGRMIVSNLHSRCIDLQYLTSGISLNIEDVIIKGATKTTANSSGEATVMFTNKVGSVIKNIKINNITVTGNSSAVASLGVFGSGAATLKDCLINYNDDAAYPVTCALYGFTLDNTFIRSHRASDAKLFMCSSNDQYVLLGDTNLVAAANVLDIFIVNPYGANVNLFKTGLTGYTINTADFITDGTYFTFTGCAAIALHFNHTAKTIKATKIG